MTKAFQSKQTLSPPGKTEYQGMLQGYQLSGSSYRGKRYQQIESDFLNNTQNLLYHRALFGLSVYKQEEIKKMNNEKRARIKRVHKKTQQILNSWKQELIICASNNLLRSLFPKSKLANQIIEESSLNQQHKCSISFESLGIKKKQIVEKLLQENILPNNFYNLKAHHVCK